LNQLVPAPLLAADAAQDFDLQGIESGRMAGTMLPDGETTVETRVFGVVEFGRDHSESCRLQRSYNPAASEQD
jgi:hypothetical protein